MRLRPVRALHAPAWVTRAPACWTLFLHGSGLPAQAEDAGILERVPTNVRNRESVAFLPTPRLRRSGPAVYKELLAAEEARLKARRHQTPLPA